MRKDEAVTHAQKNNASNNGTIAQVVRILPSNVDPVIEGDNGWDVEITVLRDDDTIPRENRR